MVDLLLRMRVGMLFNTGWIIMNENGGNLVAYPGSNPLYI